MTTSSPKRWPGQVDETYPDLFTTIPPQPKEKKPGQLSPQQIKQYFEEGYVVVENFFNTEGELEPVKEDIKLQVEELAQKLYKGGKITKLYSELGMFQRLSAIEKEFPGANIILHKLGCLPTSFRSLWSNERLLNVAEQLLGTNDIAGHPVWNLRTKTPKNTATTVPWHQDSAYLDTDSYKVMQLTAWIPLLDANENNGCMQMVPRGHCKGKVADHHCCWEDTWYITLEPEEMKKTLGVDVKDAVTIPVPYGGAAFFSNMIPHRSLNNTSEQIRWSLDLRWQRADMKVGFHGVKEGIQMRSATDPNFKIDWEAFDSVNRHTEAVKVLEAGGADMPKESEFDTTIPGPWMKQWEITHVNRHVQALLDSGTEGTKWHGLTG